MSRPGPQTSTSRALTWIQCKLGKQYLVKKCTLPWESNPGPTPIRGDTATLVASVGFKKKTNLRKTIFFDHQCAGATSAGKLESTFALGPQPPLLSSLVKLHHFILLFIINHIISIISICFKHLFLYLLPLFRLHRLFFNYYLK